MISLGERNRVLRLFFAIIPDKSTSVSLHANGNLLAKHSRGHVVAAERLHLTLAFLGEVAPERLDELLTIGESLPRLAGEVWTIDRVGGWPNGIVWAGSSQPCLVLSELVTALQQGLAQAGFPTETRPYVPHVTLLRRARHRLPPQDISPLPFVLRRVSLMESTLTPQGPQYRELRRWP
nr:RNA 2',3'-cyclic phosphodiesterase [uncultured Pseudogulbenkiania sp.]